jgi:hypothetical protein
MVWLSRIRREAELTVDAGEFECESSEALPTYAGSFREITLMKAQVERDRAGPIGGRS